MGKDKNEDDLLNTEFLSLINDYIYSLESLRDSIGIVLPAIKGAEEEHSKKITRELLAIAKRMKDGERPPTDADKLAANYLRLGRIIRGVQKMDVAPTIMANSLFISTFTIYDALIGGVVRFLISNYKPHLISEKSINLREILAFESIDAAKESILDKEVETLLRKSYSKQFDALKSDFEISTLTKGLDAWPHFIEMSQRRNIIVHSGGKVSQQYLDECAEHNVTWEQKPVLGSRLSITEDYLMSSIDVCFEIGIKLSQVLYRKSAPGSLENADATLNYVIYDLIEREQWPLAVKMAEFGFSLPHHASDYNHRMMLINLAQALKWSGQNEKANTFIDKIDWSAASDEFAICVAVLKDDFTKAIQIMKRIGANGAVSQTKYVEWPVFREFRKQDGFLSAFEVVFGCSFNDLVEQSMRETVAFVSDSDITTPPIDAAQSLRN